jgi:hypothetical protein
LRLLLQFRINDLFECLGGLSQVCLLSPCREEVVEGRVVDDQVVPMVPVDDPADVQRRVYRLHGLICVVRGSVDVNDHIQVIQVEI